MVNIPIQDATEETILSLSRHAIPSCGVGVYFICHDGIILYVGKSENVTTRVKGHLKWCMQSARLRRYLDTNGPILLTIASMEVCSAHRFSRLRGSHDATMAILTAQALEAHFIHAFHPIFNTIIPPLTSARIALLQKLFGTSQ
jgi:hypothetical protein